MNPKDKHADWLLKPTANELADLIENEDTLWLEGRLSEIATMLRQQQAEIEALKQIIDANNLNQNIGQFVKPTNEPVAWMHQNPDYAISKHQSLEYNIPLYTHPVKEHDIGISHAIGFDDGFKAGMQRAVEMNVVKELTDEEILECWNETHPAVVCLNAELPLFARAILRKAQEK